MIRWFAVVVVLLFTQGLLAQERQPNVILIMADDLGYGDLGCYGNEQIRTPHLDQLAATGVRCTDFHSNGAVCSPTRAALMTGRYQQRCGVTGVITAARHRDQGMALSEWTLAEAMREQGYATAMFGKWHLGYPSKFNPIHQGFDEFRGFVSGNIDYHNHIDQEGYFDWWIQDQKKDEPGYLTDLITDHATDFVRRKSSSPFLLVLTHGAPHYPIQGRTDPAFRVLGKANREQPKLKQEHPKEVYRGMIEAMDDGVGKIVEVLEELEIRDETLIIFCSDNGPAQLGSAGPFRGKKGTVWEGGHRVCAIFNMPQRLPKASVCAEPVLTMDLLPTLVSLAGGDVPASRPLDGIDVWSALNGESQSSRTLFWQHGQSVAVRDGDWKLVIQKKNRHLFHLDQDPAESRNLAQTRPETADRLENLIERWQSTVNSTAKRN